jgi:hypothetical protein
MSDLGSTELLTAILVALRRIETRLEAIRPQRDDELRRLIPALLGAIGSEPFAAADALDYPAVRAAGPRRTSPEALGKLLASGVGRVIDGYRIERCGRSLWRVVQMIPPISHK